MHAYIVREEMCHHFMGYSFQLTRDVLCAPSHRQDNTYHGLSYTRCGAQAVMRNSSMGPITSLVTALPMSYFLLHTYIHAYIHTYIHTFSYLHMCFIAEEVKSCLKQDHLEVVLLASSIRGI